MDKKTAKKKATKFTADYDCGEKVSPSPGVPSARMLIGHH